MLDFDAIEPDEIGIPAIEMTDVEGADEKIVAAAPSEAEFTEVVTGEVQADKLGVSSEADGPDAFDAEPDETDTFAADAVEVAVAAAPADAESDAEDPDLAAFIEDTRHDRPDPAAADEGDALSALSMNERFALFA
ncbi:hypothetical protein [Methylobrevis pamukkalensis]|uniref:Uncharacterized protein n=1 Tax=Methylobrevis pamukkalensis TaxID=1439726 RepID=A0A1E3H568_9HYPH|nr:hypothetical protein [Methylobrevis pamukkalensis]ODN71452.1 hypothetical protein A6302_01229 [Methylobrevis pamukkalensis]